MKYDCLGRRNARACDDTGWPVLTIVCLRPRLTEERKPERLLLRTVWSPTQSVQHRRNEWQSRRCCVRGRRSYSTRRYARPIEDDHARSGGSATTTRTKQSSRRQGSAQLLLPDSAADIFHGAQIAPGLRISIPRPLAAPGIVSQLGLRQRNIDVLIFAREVSR